MISNQYYTNITYNKQNKQMEDLLDKAYKKYVIWKEGSTKQHFLVICGFEEGFVLLSI